MTLTEGSKSGRYEIRSLLGVGGIDEVIRAPEPKIEAGFVFSACRSTSRRLTSEQNEDPNP